MLKRWHMSTESKAVVPDGLRAQSGNKLVMLIILPKRYSLSKGTHQFRRRRHPWSRSLIGKASPSLGEPASVHPYRGANPTPLQLTPSYQHPTPPLPLLSINLNKLVPKTLLNVCRLQNHVLNTNLHAPSCNIIPPF